jgi:hypothetical protein
MQIPEPKDFQGLGLPRVLYTSPGYASLSLFPTVHYPPPGSNHSYNNEIRNYEIMK